MQVVRNIEPQPGFQWSVLESPADVVIMGGSAGCGKTFALLLEGIRHLDVSGYNAIIFRREHVQIFATGGLWDKALELYLSLPMPYTPTVRQNNPSFKFPSNASINFGHLNQTLDVLKYQGAEIAYIGFDELTHFEEYQFFYMLSRNRTTCGVRPVIRASTNPQGSGWVKELIQWWLYPDDFHIESLRAFPIKERAGVLRYFVRYHGEIIWGDNQHEVWEQLPEHERGQIPESSIKSITFIGGKLAENPALTSKDPGYVGGLLAQSEIDRVQLLDGRWIDPNLDDRRLYEDAEIYDFFTNSFVKGTGLAKDRYLTADVALEGGDRFTVGIWDDWVLEHYYESVHIPPEEVQPWLEGLAKKHGVPRSNISFDATGIGSMLRGYLSNARPVVGASTPLEDKEEIGKGQNKAKRSQYLNLRVQLFYKFKDILANRQAFCAVDDIDLRRNITAELKAIKKGITLADGKLRIIPNEEIRLLLKGKSPDLAVMIVQRSIFELKPATRKVHTRKVRAIS